MMAYRKGLAVNTVRRSKNSNLEEISDGLCQIIAMLLREMSKNFDNGNEFVTDVISRNEKLW